MESTCRSLRRLSCVLFANASFNGFGSLTETGEVATTLCAVTDAPGCPGSSCGVTTSVTVVFVPAASVLMVQVTVMPAAGAGVAALPEFTQFCATGNVPFGFVSWVRFAGPLAPGKVTVNTTLVASDGPALLTTI